MRSNTHICNAKDIEVSEDVRKEQLGWLSCVSKAILKQNIIECLCARWHIFMER